MIGPAHGNLSGKQLVIFGCGYVGGQFAREAVERGLRVTALTRNPDKAAALRAAGVATVVADLAETSWHAALPREVDFVVNCVSSGGGGLDGYRRSYVDGTASVISWAKSVGGVRSLVYTSSTSVYPQGQGMSVDEQATTMGGGERPTLLLEAEALVRSGPATAACHQATVLRLAGIYGPGRHHLLDQVRAGVVAGRGDFRLNLIHRDDICRALWAALTRRGHADDVYNIADDGAAPKSVVVAWLAEKLGLPMPVFTGEPAKGRREVTPDRVIVNAKARAHLGWTPRYRTFREGYENLLSQPPGTTL